MAEESKAPDFCIESSEMDPQFAAAVQRAGHAIALTMEAIGEHNPEVVQSALLDIMARVYVQTARTAEHDAAFASTIGEGLRQSILLRRTQATATHPKGN